MREPVVGDLGQGSYGNKNRVQAEAQRLAVKWGRRRSLGIICMYISGLKACVAIIYYSNI